MKLGTQSVDANGPTAFASGLPTVLPTNPNSPFAKLIVRSELGQIIQQWLMLQHKCTLGSASSCALRCQLPGIAPYHALLVVGSRQVFIRALSPKLARNGVMVNELLLTEDQSTFEIAGHQFELIRSVKINEPTSANKPSAGKLKFTLARPMEIGQARQPSVIATQPSMQTPTQAFERIQPGVMSSELQPQWITDLIQSAMLPLERQLNEIIEPLAAVQNRLEKQSRLERKRRQRKANRPAPETAETMEIAVSPQIAPVSEPVIVPIISPEVQSQLAMQSETLDTLSDRLTEVKNNLGSLERVVSESFVTVMDAASAPVPTPEPVHQALQRITSVADQLTGLTSQMDDLKSTLGSLERIVSENLVSTNALRAAPEPATNEALQRLAHVANQLSDLLQDVSTRQISTGDSDLAWREQLRSQIGELRETVSETESSILKAAESSIKAVESSILIATESSLKATESSILKATDSYLKAAESSILIATESSLKATQSSILKVLEIQQAALTETCPPSTALVPNTYLNVATLSEPLSPQPAIQLQAPPTLEPAGAMQVNSPSEVAVNGFAALVEEMAEISELESNTIEPEGPANLFNQYAWHSKTSDAATPADAIDAIDAPESVGSIVDRNMQESIRSTPALEFADASANFIEEAFEEIPLAEQVDSSALPAWWTEDDKTQFKGEPSAAVALGSDWGIPSNSNVDMPQSIDSDRQSSIDSREFAHGIASEASDNESMSASDVQLDYENACEHEAPAVSDFAVPAPVMTHAATRVTQENATAEETLSEESLKSDASSELASFLERFGIARTPDSSEPKVSLNDPISIAKPGYEASPQELPSQDFAAFVRQSEQDEVDGIDSAGVEPISQQSVASAMSGSVAVELGEVGEEESIEDYMKRLMARMRGDISEDDIKPNLPTPTASVLSAAPQDLDSVSSFKLQLPASATERASAGTTSSFHAEEYVPKALAPEKYRNMAAMRELANTSARSAIQVSARRRYGTAIALRLAIALTGLSVGVLLVMINGLQVNIGLIATVASFLVAMIWGYDAFSTLKPILYAAAETRDVVAISPEAEGVDRDGSNQPSA